MEYYIIVNNAKQGPYPMEELARKNITSRTLVWRQGLDDWTEASEMQELHGLLNQTPPEVPKGSPESPNSMPYPPKTWLVESILVTCCCCLPLGIVGIINATKVESLYYSKQYEQALYHSNQAKLWTAWGFFLMVGLVGLYILFIIVMAFTGIAASLQN